jgi:hypothetical protein
MDRSPGGISPTETMEIFPLLIPIFIGFNVLSRIASCIVISIKPSARIKMYLSTRVSVVGLISHVKLT